MKRILSLALLSLFITVASAQKIESSIIDDFTGGKVIYTSWEKIRATSGKNNIYVRFRYENKTQFLHFKWITNEKTAIDEDAKIIFKLSNDNTVALNSLYSSRSKDGDGAIGFWMSGLEGIENTYVGNFSDFAQNEFFGTKIRIYARKGYTDLDLKEKEAKKLNEIYMLLLKEIGTEANTTKKEDADF